MSKEAIEIKSGIGPGPSVGQEIANAVTHGAGTLLAVAGLVLLVVAAAARGTVWHLVSYSVFGASMVLLYLASTLYHSLSRTRAGRVFEILDHSAIFVLIAGTYTVYALTLLRPTIGWWLFGIVWGIAVVGIVFEAIFLNRWPIVTVLVYVAMGWLIVFAWKPLSAAATPATLGFLIAGGLAYTLGTLFYVRGRRRGWYHAGWHVFVLAGTTCHFFSALAALPN
jgi:hemolysin III